MNLEVKIRIFFRKNLWIITKTLLYLHSQLQKRSSLNIAKESCLRGRKDMFAKHAYWKRYQGFESLTLRNNCQKNYSGRSVVRSSRLVWDQEVAGSNPAAPTFIENSFESFFFYNLSSGTKIEKPILGCVAQLDRASAF